jgi:cytochrome P450
VNTDDSLPRLPFTQPHALEIAPELRKLQAEQPVAQVRTAVGDLAWVITRYDDVKELSADERIGHSHDDPEQAPRFSDSVLLGRPAFDAATEQQFSTRVRRLLTPAFTPRRMRAMQGGIDELVAVILDRMADSGPPLDLQDSLSLPLPVMVICGLLGVPHEDHVLFRGWSEAAAGMTDPEKAGAAFGDLLAYMHPQIERKRKEPADDVISDLVAAADEWRLTDDDIALFAGMLLFAGHASTSVRIDFGTCLLLCNPDQLNTLRRDPGMILRAVEEIVRMTTAGDSGLTRYASSDVEIRGVTIHKGDAVLLATAMANRDGRVFPDPDRFDVTREPNPHLGFGYGRHFCIGASLARAELTAVFSQLFQHFPTMRLAVPVEQLEVRTEILTGGLAELPVTWS